MALTSTAETLRADVTAALHQLAAMTDEAARSDIFRSWLRTIARFHKYSWHNQLLIWLQRPDATQVAGYQTWKQMGRTVRKGAEGIAILAPLLAPAGQAELILEEVETASETPAKVAVRFRKVYVFDISDTAGDPLPRLVYRADFGGERLLPRLEEAAKRLDIRLEYRTIPGEARGYSAGGVVVVESALTATQRCGTILHELAHELLHQGRRGAEAGATDTQSREMEAEAVSWTVLSVFGVRQPSEFYLASWGVDAKALTRSIDLISRTVNAILSAIPTAAETADAVEADRCRVADTQPRTNTMALETIFSRASLLAELALASEVSETKTTIPR